MTSTTQAPGSEHNFQQKVIRSGQPHWISWVVLTICTALIPVTWAYIEMTPNPPAFLAVIGLFVCAITIGGAVYMTVYQGQSYARLFQLFTNLSPTILLMSVFPFISGTLNSQSIGNSRELMVVLAVSVTVPWIASTVSMPVYEPLATVDRRDTALLPQLLPTVAAVAAVLHSGGGSFCTGHAVRERLGRLRDRLFHGWRVH